VSTGRLFVGTSGWSYDHWRGLFYPEDLPRSKWFAHYAKHFSTVEINYSFYRLPSEKTFRRWHDQGPSGFVYALKAPAAITHLKKLHQPKESLQMFLERARLLEDKLGPILYQLPPNWRCNVGRLSDFLAMLPADLQYAVEFRDKSWFCDEVFELLRENGVSFCIASLPGLSCPSVVTGPIVYVRMHGAEIKYGDSYDEEQLRNWSGCLRGFLDQGLDTFVYFNNDAYAYAVKNARELKRLVEESEGSEDAEGSHAVREAG
jgi:uncharacterized protein YecE (DUF72 family)